MELDEILGIAADDKVAQHAKRLVELDRELVRDLRAVREGKDMSQAELARRMDISQSAVARIESGERDPLLSTLRRYAMGVGVIIEHKIADAGLERVRRVNEEIASQVQAVPSFEWHNVKVGSPAMKKLLPK